MARHQAFINETNLYSSTNSLQHQSDIQLPNSPLINSQNLNLSHNNINPNSNTNITNNLNLNGSINSTNHRHQVDFDEHLMQRSSPLKTPNQTPKTNRHSLSIKPTVPEYSILDEEILTANNSLIHQNLTGQDRGQGLQSSGGYNQHQQSHFFGPGNNNNNNTQNYYQNANTNNTNLQIYDSQNSHTNTHLTTSAPYQAHSYGPPHSPYGPINPHGPQNPQNLPFNQNQQNLRSNSGQNPQNILPKFGFSENGQIIPTNSNKKTRNNSNKSPLSSRRSKNEDRDSNSTPSNRAEFKHLIQVILNQSDNIKNLETIIKTQNSQIKLLTNEIKILRANSQNLINEGGQAVNETQILEKLDQLKSSLTVTISRQLNSNPTKIYQSVECQTNSLYKGDAFTMTENFESFNNLSTPKRGVVNETDSRSKSGSCSGRSGQSQNQSNASHRSSNETTCRNFSTSEETAMQRPAPTSNDQSYASQMTNHSGSGTSNISPQLGDSATNFAPVARPTEHRRIDEEQIHQTRQQREATDAMLSDVINDVDRVLNKNNQNLGQIIFQDDIEATETEQTATSLSRSPESAADSRKIVDEKENQVARNASNTTPGPQPLDQSEYGQMKRVLDKTKQQLEAFGISFDPLTGNVEKSSLADKNHLTSPVIPSLNLNLSQNLNPASHNNDNLLYQKNLNFLSNFQTFDSQVGSAPNNNNNNNNNNMSMHVNALAMKYLSENHLQNLPNLPSMPSSSAAITNTNTLGSPRSILKSKGKLPLSKVTFAENGNVTRQVIQVQPYNYQPSTTSQTSNTNNNENQENQNRDNQTLNQLVENKVNQQAIPTPDGDGNEREIQHGNADMISNRSPDMSLATRAYFEKYGIIENCNNLAKIGNVLDESVDQVRVE